MPHAGGGTKRRPVYWWSADIAEQRKSCLKARRAYTRKRKRADEAGS
ncbi:Endo/exonuclease/phosphatase domain-containing protein, partial [Aphis craccivora]